MALTEALPEVELLPQEEALALRLPEPEPDPELAGLLLSEREPVALGLTVPATVAESMD